jgi:hypothetical protein
MPVIDLPLVYAYSGGESFTDVSVEGEYDRERAPAAHHPVVVPGVLDPQARMRVNLGQRLPVRRQALHNLGEGLGRDVIITPGHLLTRGHD